MGLKWMREQHSSALHSSFHWLQIGLADGNSPVQSKGYQAILHQCIIGQRLISPPGLKTNLLELNVLVLHRHNTLTHAFPQHQGHKYISTKELSKV